MEIATEQLVQVKYLVNVITGEVISTNYNFYNATEYNKNFSIRRLKTWVRVKFIDSDGTFIEEVERAETNKWSEVKINILYIDEPVKISIDRVSAIEDKSKSFCYSDNVTQCSCTGTCRNK